MHYHNNVTLSTDYDWIIKNGTFKKNIVTTSSWFCRYLCQMAHGAGYLAAACPCPPGTGMGETVAKIQPHSLQSPPCFSCHEDVATGTTASYGLPLRTVAARTSNSSSCVTHGCRGQGTGHPGHGTCGLCSYRRRLCAKRPRITSLRRATNKAKDMK